MGFMVPFRFLFNMASVLASVPLSSVSLSAAAESSLSQMRALLDQPWDYDLLLYENPLPVQYAPTPRDLELIQFYHRVYATRFSVPESAWRHATADLSKEHRDSLSTRAKALVRLGGDFMWGGDEWRRIVYGPSDEEFRARWAQHAFWKAQDEIYRAEGLRLAPEFKKQSLHTQVYFYRFNENVSGLAALMSLLTEEELESVWEEARHQDELAEESYCDSD